MRAGLKAEPARRKAVFAVGFAREEWTLRARGSHVVQRLRPASEHKRDLTPLPESQRACIFRPPNF